MTDDSADKARTWRPMDIAALATRLGVVTALGFGYWHAASLSAVLRLAETYHACHVVRSAHVVPNRYELMAALLGVAVAISIYGVAWASRSKTRSVGRIVALVMFPFLLGIMVLYMGWWAMLFSVGFSIVGTAVIAALDISGLIELPGTGDDPKWDRYHALVLLGMSILAGLLVTLGLVLGTVKERSVVLPEFGEVVILRSDSVGHFALDDDGHLMWLSRSKVDMIMVAPKSDEDTTTSENP